MARNPHFLSAPSWKAAAAQLTFQPRRPKNTAGRRLRGLRIHVRDHRSRDLPIGDRTLEAHYGSFVLSQSLHGEEEARRLALSTSYGVAPRVAWIGGHEARSYELGPEPNPDDIDGRRPAVVVWHDAGIVFLIASTELPVDALTVIAGSLY
jgi:hypothetical protein